MPLTPDLSFTSLDEFVNKPIVENSKAMSSEEEPKNMVPRAVLMTSSLVSVNTARKVNNAYIKTTVNAARPMSGKEVNTARPKAIVDDVKGNNVNAVRALACWVWKPKTKVLDH
ncbi:hypothetical protein Tco_0114330, partial [Tanacetum coccineum]